MGRRIEDVSLDVHPGEVVGLGGLDGQGQRQFLLALFGALIGVEGKIEIAGKPVKIASPRHAKSPELGLALIPEDRKNEGLMLPMTVRENLSFAALESVSRFGRIDRKAEGELIDALVRQLAIKSDGLDGPVAALSGGNQQKVVIGKWLMTKPRIVLLNDPTRGIDVGRSRRSISCCGASRNRARPFCSIRPTTTNLSVAATASLSFMTARSHGCSRVPNLTEHNLVGAALNIAPGTPQPVSQAAR